MSLNGLPQAMPMNMGMQMQPVPMAPMQQQQQQVAPQPGPLMQRRPALGMPDAVPNVQVAGDTPPHTVLVRNIPPELNNFANLSTHFERFGVVSNIRVRARAAPGSCRRLQRTWDLLRVPHTHARPSIFQILAIILCPEAICTGEGEIRNRQHLEWHNLAQ